MNKRKAIVKFCVICALVALGIVFCFANFRIPFTSSKFVGFVGAIENKMGIDLKGGVLAVFDCESKEGNTGAAFNDQIDATVRRLESALTSKGFVESTVVRQGNKIRIEVPGMKETDEIFQAIGQPAELDFRNEAGEIFLTGKDIKKVETTYQNDKNEYGVILTFTSAGGEKFRTEVKNESNSKLYIYRNGTQFSAPTIQDRNAGANNTTVITSSAYKTVADANKFKLEIESGLFDVRLNASETSVIPPTLGEGALMGGIIALIVGLIFIFIFMYLLYGDLGLLSNLSMLIFTVLFLGALAIVGSVQLTLPGIAGIILSLGMAVDANVIIFERIRDEYNAGKRMGVAMESGFNKSVVTIVDSNITTIIAAVVLYFLGTGAIKGFAITLALGVAISMLCSLVVTRSFAKLYLQINKNNAKRLRLKKQETVAEVKPPKTGKRSLNLGE